MNRSLVYMQIGWQSHPEGDITTMGDKSPKKELKAPKKDIKEKRKDKADKKSGKGTF
jgi:hypothetical protein